MLLVPGFGVFSRACLTWARISRSVCIMGCFCYCVGNKISLNITGNEKEATSDMELNVRT